MPTIIKHPGEYYPPSLDMVYYTRSYVKDVYGFYQVLGLDPNSHYANFNEIRSAFKKTYHRARTEATLRAAVEAFKTLSNTKARFAYDSLIGTAEEILECLPLSQASSPVADKNRQFTYYTDGKFEVPESVLLQYLRFFCVCYHRIGTPTVPRICFSHTNEWKEIKYEWGSLVQVSLNYEPTLQYIAENLTRLMFRDRWLLPYSKIMYQE